MSKEAILKIRNAEERAAGIRKEAVLKKREIESCAVSEGEHLLKCAEENGIALLNNAKKDADNLILSKTKEARTTAEKEESGVWQSSNEAFEQATDYIVRSVTL